MLPDLLTVSVFRNQPSIPRDIEYLPPFILTLFMSYHLITYLNTPQDNPQDNIIPP